MEPHDPTLPHSRTPPSHTVEVAAGLVFRDGKLLITQRHADDHLGGLWEFPGGKRESGESFEQCLRREIMEELGCEVEVGERIDSINHDYPEKSVRLEFYLCRWIAIEPQPIDCAACRWVTQVQLADFEFPAADARLLERLRQPAAWWDKGS
jgi:8-oxo-dGTP diphosphatase